MAKLSKSIAVITGGASGIGKATAMLFASEGAAVVIAHHDEDDDAQSVVDAIRSRGGSAIAIKADVRDEADVDALFAKTRADLGSPTVLVNAAGVDASGVRLADMEVDAFENVLRTNLIGPFLFCRAFLRSRGASKARAKIINVTSVHEDIPRAGATDYCASKGGLRNLTRCLALELAEQGVTVNNLAPGMILTPMNQEAIDDPAVRKEQTDSIPMKRAGEPEEVAKLALYLASDASDYATGATFTLDGGLQMNLGQGA
jgi:glucose 1-dehydrogenase